MTIEDAIAATGANRAVESAILLSIETIQRDWQRLTPQAKLELRELIHSSTYANTLHSRLELSHRDELSLRVPWHISDVIYYEDKEHVYSEYGNVGLDLKAHSIDLNAGTWPHFIDQARAAVHTLMIRRGRIDRAAATYALAFQSHAVSTELRHRLREEFKNLRSDVMDSFSSVLHDVADGSHLGPDSCLELDKIAVVLDSLMSTLSEQHSDLQPTSKDLERIAVLGQRMPPPAKGNAGAESDQKGGPEVDPVTVITLISAGLKMVDQFRELAIRFRGEKASPPGTRAEQVGTALEVHHGATLVQKVEASQLRMDEWDTARYSALAKRIRTEWDIFNDLFASEAGASPQEGARIRAEMRQYQEKLCADFKEMVALYERALGTSLPDHYRLFEVCQG
jgi:hypothetical protein